MERPFSPQAEPHGGRKLRILIIACFLYFVGRAPYIGQWDSFDYLKQIVTHHFSDLGMGRPVYIGYNILLWESLKKMLGLTPLQVESVVLTGTILLGGAGVLAFDRLSRQLLRKGPSAMATLGLLLSPVYALYSGYVMTEVPMLLAVILAATTLWQPDRTKYRDVSAGLLFGVAVGIREQALTLAGAFLWILWVRRSGLSSRLHSIARFGCAAFLAIVVPIGLLFLQDPPGFTQRTSMWLRAIPMSEVHVWKNIQASLLYTFLLCPAAWLAALGAGVYRLWSCLRELSQDGRSEASSYGERKIQNSLLGFVCSMALPLVILWRDADVQIHPRYTLIVLPASLILCAALFQRWVGSSGTVGWALLHVIVFGIAQAGLQPLRQFQAEKREYVQTVRAVIPGPALLIGGAYSPVFDYYRGVQDRPGWRVLWSGWNWNPQQATALISESWARGEPVYLCNGPAAWFRFEEQLLELHDTLRHSSREVVAPGLIRIDPE